MARKQSVTAKKVMYDPDDGPDYVVGKKQTLLVSGERFDEDDQVPDDLLAKMTVDKVARLIADEVIVEFHAAPKRTRRNPGDSVTTTSVKPQDPPSTGGKGSGHKFGLDPAGLKGLSLDVLNTRLVEMDPTAKPFDDVAEAIAFLSKDYKPSK